MSPSLFLLTLLTGGMIASSVEAQLANEFVSPADPYAPKELVAGELSISGSRTMSQLAAVWSDGLRHIHPEFATQLDFQGSETALDRLIGETPSIGLMSRELSDEEQQEFSAARQGLRLLAINTAHDAVAVIVHPDNPLEGLTLDQLKTLFATQDGSDGLTWSVVGVDEDEWKDRPVVRLIPDAQSGARGQFAARVFGGEVDLHADTEHSWHTKIVEVVATDPGAIGVVSYQNTRTDRVRTVPIADEEGEPLVAPFPGSIATGGYPLIRPLSIVVAVGDDGVRDPLVSEFLRYVLSREGQADVVKDGFQPLGRSELLEQFDRLGWNRVK